MSEADIEVMYQFDRAALNSDRRFCNHNQFMEEQYFSNGDAAEDDKSPLLKNHLDALSASDEGKYFAGRCDWPETAEDSRLADMKNVLSQEETAFLSHIAADGLTPAELSRKLGVSPAAVSKRLKRIRIKLEKSCGRGVNKVTAAEPTT
jgi:DNA-directed RNA polymerase specialized sigma24 family protein